MTPEHIVKEGLGELIPRRKENRNRKTNPTVLTVELNESSDRWKWYQPPVRFTEEEKLVIMAKVTEIMVQSVFRTHHYKFNGKVYKQQAGGPIGLKDTGYVARLTMDKWIQQFRSKLEEHGLKIKLLRKYVDDIVIVVDNLS